MRRAVPMMSKSEKPRVFYSDARHLRTTLRMHIDDSSLFLQTRFIPREIGIYLAAIDACEWWQTENIARVRSAELFILTEPLIDLFFFSILRDKTREPG